MESGKLYIIPTPIGNLEDITYRAVDYLKQADIILVEDTRVSAKLFAKYGIKPRRKIAFHKFNEHQLTSKIVILYRKAIK